MRGKTEPSNHWGLGLEEEWAGILFLRFSSFYFIFYLSPAENGEILPSPAGSSSHLSICKSSRFQSQEPERMLRPGWQGWISGLHLLWKS